MAGLHCRRCWDSKLRPEMRKEEGVWTRWELPPSEALYSNCSVPLDAINSVYEASLLHFLTLISMSTLMEESQKATDTCLRQVNILVCVLLSSQKREKLATEK